MTTLLKRTQNQEHRTMKETNFFSACDYDLELIH